MREDMPVLKVHMLGGFSIIYGDKPLSFGRNNTTKAVKLLQILLYNKDHGIERSRLQEELFGREQCVDAANNLRVTVHRLKKILQAAGLPDFNYIMIGKGIYYWNSPMKVEIDAQTFAALADEGLSTDDKTEQIRILKEACGIYKGEFLPALSSDEWVLIESLQYKKKYSDAMQKVCDLLMEKGDYEETLRVCAPACKLYPFDEWQTVRIRCYIALNRYKEAMKEYEDTAKLFFEELGLGPSEKMLELFENMSSNMTSRPQTLSEIRGKLLEDEKEGAYYVNFPSFRDNCRLVSRIIERSGQSVFLMQCSITDGKGRPMENEEKLRYMMQELSKAIKYNLRRGDAFTQYSSSQYLILLIGTNQEDCSIIYDRIQKYYTRNHGSWSKHLEYQILSIMALESTGG